MIKSISCAKLQNADDKGVPFDPPFYGTLTTITLMDGTQRSLPTVWTPGDVDHDMRSMQEVCGLVQELIINTIKAANNLAEIVDASKS